VVMDAYRRRRLVIALLPLLHWLWVNGHQLFILSFLVQGLFLGHLLLARWGRFGVDREDAALPIAPVVAALVASVALTFASPLRTAVLGVFAHTAGSLAHHRNEVQELARVWSDPVWLVMALAIMTPAAALLVRARRCWSPFEVGLFLLTAAMAASAIRGLVYATLVSGVVFQRTWLRQPPAWKPSPLLRQYFRWLKLAGTLALGVAVLQQRWLHPPQSLDGTESGVGRSEGDWPDAALAALRTDPPPGNMMNLPWYSGNALILSWPEQPVFVDPRFEAYPRDFLLKALASRRDDAVLGRLLANYRPGWMFVEHCTDLERARVAHLVEGGHWQLTYADVRALVLVNRSPRSEAYRARHPFTPPREPDGLVPARGPRRALQRVCYARLMSALGYVSDARVQLSEAATDAIDDLKLREEIARLAQALPDGTSAP
jgi:hypothetical protein